MKKADWLIAVAFMMMGGLCLFRSATWIPDITSSLGRSIFGLLCIAGCVVGIVLAILYMKFRK